MKIYIMTVVTVLTCTFGTFAEHQNYWNLSAGWAQPSDADAKTAGINLGEVDYDAGFVIEGALGMRSDTMPIAVEIALSYLNTEGDFEGKGDVNQWTTMLNGMYYLDLSTEIETYLLGGIGIVSTEAELSEESVTVDIGDTVFGGQLGVGIAQPIDDGCSISLEYKYLFANDFESFGLEVEQGGHSIQIGYTRMY